MLDLFANQCPSIYIIFPTLNYHCFSSNLRLEACTDESFVDKRLNLFSAKHDFIFNLCLLFMF